PEKIFVADFKIEKWIKIDKEKSEFLPAEFMPEGRLIAISAIGNPSGFYKFVEDLGIETAAKRTFRDHHILTREDFEELNSAADRLGAVGFICTEKDLMNLSKQNFLDRPLYVPAIEVSMRDTAAFRKKISELLRPSFLVTSNGYGEDAIGLVLAKKLSERFPSAQVDAFAFVGSGKAYAMNGIRVVSPPADMPSGGVVKYHLKDLLRDLRNGLGSVIIKQRDKLRSLNGHYRTPLCVGDVYLLLNVLWGQGMKPILAATAKTVHLNGHLRIEKWLLRRRCVLVWTRDEETARDLVKSGVPAVFYGNPIMDLLDEVKSPAFVWNGGGANVLLLPGSRPRAYDDIKLILDTASLLAEKVQCNFVMVPAPTIDTEKLVNNLEGWRLSEDGKRLVSDTASVSIVREPVAAVACGAEVLVGLGGTANQLCAGLGVPVVSIIERGKLRQKKLIREAETLVPAKPEALAEAALKILQDDKLRRFMQEAGIKNLGRTGALEKVVEYCANELGWEARCRVYEKYRDYVGSCDNL
ncbi:MAG: tetraacyldisaccharide 4'-kinase, partial [Synergistes sp.]|nr:tetraacyldisaccharide 4'-kinase [Synergistes sp.]